MDKAVQLFLGAGVTAVFHPVAYTKVLIQIGHEPLAPALSSTLFGSKNYMYPNVFKYIGHIHRTDGFLGLYRGLGARVISHIVSNYVSNAVQTELVGQPLNTDCTDADAAAAGQAKDSEQIVVDEAMKMLRDTAYETLSRSAGILVSQPFHVIFVRSVAQFIGRETKYCSITSSIYEIYQNDGILGFFSGLIPRLLGEILTIWLANILTHAINTFVFSSNQAASKEMKSYSGMFSQLVVSQITYPFGLVANIMAVNNSGLIAGSPPSMPHYNGWIDCWTRLSTEDKVPVFQPCLMSGIQPTGIPHVGNYFGAIQHWIQLQNSGKYDRIFIAVVDLHAIMLPQKPVILRENILDVTAGLLACGIDTNKTVLFQQSSVSEHAELGWILGCLTTMNKLEHLPQWKDKSESNVDVPLGLFTYPVLQAADILLYKATDVPVGDDQVKHIELARHLAKQFNKSFSNIFPTPRSITGEFKRIRSLQNPLNKMSKSEKDSRGRIELSDTPDEIREKLRKSVMDAMSNITYEPESRPGIANLIELHAAFTDLTPEEICEQNLHLDTLEYKNLVADVIVEKLKPIRGNIVRLKSDPAYLYKTLNDGNERASNVALATYKEVRKSVGFI